MEKPPFQFGLRAIFAAMTFVAVLMALVVNAPALADGLDPPLDALFSLMLGAALILGMSVALFAIDDGIKKIVLRSIRSSAWRRF